ncbi:hypothetical protein T03_3971 [Trichinella britovi]|uniref:Uncharacterized protein n=1 Tax=Trichinella britovi TaxID=45882 RepID=A0A0V0Z391_TRIBR|nr:hypothetical protein T03_3971 [Trichinella britovi]
MKFAIVEKHLGIQKLTLWASNRSGTMREEKCEI